MIRLVCAQVVSYYQSSKLVAEGYRESVHMSTDKSVLRRKHFLALHDNKANISAITVDDLRRKFASLASHRIRRRSPFF